MCAADIALTEAIRAAIRELQNSPMAKALRDFENSGGMAKALRELQNSPMAKALRDFENSGGMAKALRELQNSPMAKALRELQQSPAATALRLPAPHASSIDKR
jgi:Arc/MetJ-type ribon-helix-helix transcriptional regulator